MALDLSEVVNDPEMGVSVVVLRTMGQFGPTGWEPTGEPEQIPAIGIMMVADETIIEKVPEADKIHGSITFITATPIYTTLAAGNMISDQIQWGQDVYSVKHVGPWFQNGYYSATLLRETGD